MRRPCGRGARELLKAVGLRTPSYDAPVPFGTICLGAALPDRWAFECCGMVAWSRDYGISGRHTREGGDAEGMREAFPEDFETATSSPCARVLALPHRRGHRSDLDRAAVLHRPQVPRRRVTRKQTKSSSRAGDHCPRESRQLTKKASPFKTTYAGPGWEAGASSSPKGKPFPKKKLKPGDRDAKQALFPRSTVEKRPMVSAPKAANGERRDRCSCFARISGVNDE